MPSICDILLSVGFKFDRSCFFIDELDDVDVVVDDDVDADVVVFVVDDDDDDVFVVADEVYDDASKISFFISSLNLPIGELPDEQELLVNNDDALVSGDEIVVGLFNVSMTD